MDSPVNECSKQDEEATPYGSLVQGPPPMFSEVVENARRLDPHLLGYF